uniref:Secreted protein n=1 Tax=Strongyloides venezuelensis TaxID=75913 RepID=A0A0K0FUA2_STRVS
MTSWPKMTGKCGSTTSNISLTLTIVDLLFFFHVSSRQMRLKSTHIQTTHCPPIDYLLFACFVATQFLSTKANRIPVAFTL